MQRNDVIQSPVTALDSGQYSRTVNTGQVIGTSKSSIPVVGGKETTWIKITTYPIPEP
ncbi:hypothetical protein VQL36_20485 [Chengkuizengella sp. SCS-71B]|uniref:hypothetical protein n=1 Tax=Chengkuizengella sp. SCS-71B TaxID=3115290 RepID=UPI0032C21B9B